MGIVDLGYQLCERTGNAFFELYDIATAVVALPFRVLLRRKKKRSNRRGFLTGARQQFSLGVTNSGQHAIKKASPKKKKPVAEYTAPTPHIPISSTQSSKPITRMTLRAKAEANSTQSKEKIHKLENELSRLRAEIAKLMTAEAPADEPTETIAVDCKNPTETLPTIEEPKTVTDTENQSNVPVPPPPPPMSRLLGTEKPKQAFGRSSTMSSCDTIRSTDTRVTLSLEEIVAQRTSLRQVKPNKTPGGTPVKNENNHPNMQRSSSQDLIAIALKRKFSSVNRSPSALSPERSPAKYKSRKPLQPIQSPNGNESQASEWEDPWN